MKICKGQCKQEKDILLFHKNRKNIDGHSKICKECKRENDNQWAQKSPEKLKKIKKKWKENNPDKVKTDTKKWKSNNKEKVKITKKNWADKNPERVKENNKKWVSNNIDKIKFKRKNRRKEKIEKSPFLKLRESVSCSITKHLKNNNSSKNKKSCFSKLGYTIEDLKERIESFFSMPENTWMNWNNNGKYIKKYWNDNDPSTWKWQLDHIIPHSEFNYLNMDCQEFKDCWALNNLRPLSAKQNQLDGAKKIRHRRL
jgi:hypothetical protein